MCDASCSTGVNPSDWQLTKTPRYVNAWSPSPNLPSCDSLCRPQGNNSGASTFGRFSPQYMTNPNQQAMGACFEAPASYRKALYTGGNCSSLDDSCLPSRGAQRVVDSRYNGGSYVTRDDSCIPDCNQQQQQMYTPQQQSLPSLYYPQPQQQQQQMCMPQQQQQCPPGMQTVCVPYCSPQPQQQQQMCMPQQQQCPPGIQTVCVPYCSPQPQQQQQMCMPQQQQQGRGSSGGHGGYWTCTIKPLEDYNNGNNNVYGNSNVYGNNNVYGSSNVYDSSNGNAFGGNEGNSFNGGGMNGYGSVGGGGYDGMGGQYNMNAYGGGSRYGNGMDGNNGSAYGGGQGQYSNGGDMNGNSGFAGGNNNMNGMGGGMEGSSSSNPPYGGGGMDLNMEGAGMAGTPYNGYANNSNEYLVPMAANNYNGYNNTPQPNYNPNYIFPNAVQPYTTRAGNYPSSRSGPPAWPTAIAGRADNEGRGPRPSRMLLPGYGLGVANNGIRPYGDENDDWSRPRSTAALMDELSRRGGPLYSRRHADPLQPLRDRNNSNDFNPHYATSYDRSFTNIGPGFLPVGKRFVSMLEGPAYQ